VNALELSLIEKAAHVAITLLSGLISPSKRPDYFGAARASALAVIEAKRAGR
jgi:hypothetical protein